MCGANAKLEGRVTQMFAWNPRGGREGRVSTDRSKLSISSGLPARDLLLTLLKPSLRLTGIREVPGMFAIVKQIRLLARLAMQLCVLKAKKKWRCRNQQGTGTRNSIREARDRDSDGAHWNLSADDLGLA